MKSLNRQLSKLKTSVEYGEKENIKVSKANVAWHIEHSLLVIIKMTEAVGKSEPDKYRRQFNFKRELVFILREFSRGRGKAPDDVNPK